MRERMIRNPKRDKRQYFFVDGSGIRSELPSNLFELSEENLGIAMASSRLVVLGDRDVDVYLGVRNRLAEACAKGKQPFVAAALRQLLSTYEQFRASKFGRQLEHSVPKLPHPKLRALDGLVSQAIETQMTGGGARQRGWLEKLLVFTTYVGAEHSGDFVPGEERHGTASAIKRMLEATLRRLLGSEEGTVQHRVRDALIRTLAMKGACLTNKERIAMDRHLRRFAGTTCAGYLLSMPANLKREAKYLGRHLAGIGKRSQSLNWERRRRENDRRSRRLENLRDRYATRDLVARYDGAIDHEDRDRHLRGFNSPFAPLVLIASSIGQEGIDLQRYCSHVIHYDLEWNPARLEQREGRVDRQGREAKGPVNVYFLICRDTYDERVLHVMANRMRWHQMLLANRRQLQSDPGQSEEPPVSPDLLRQVTLDLRPRA
jgi:hypothetical protein